MWKEAVDKREGTTLQFLSQDVVGEGWEESSLFILLCPAMGCAMRCILENAP